MKLIATLFKTLVEWLTPRVTLVPEAEKSARVRLASRGVTLR
jgi:hypothetical protein